MSISELISSYLGESNSVDSLPFAVVKSEKNKYYHASPHKFSVGDIVSTGEAYESPLFDFESAGVCMTNSPIPHASIAHSIDGKWHVFEVEPLYDVSYVKGNGEYRTLAAKVVKKVGNAVSILKNSGTKGSWVMPRDSNRTWEEPSKIIRK